MDMIKQKVKIDNIVNQAQKGVLKDHSQHLSKLQKDLEFIQKVRALAMEKFEDNREAYLNSKEGNMMEANLLKAE